MNGIDFQRIGQFVPAPPLTLDYVDFCLERNRLALLDVSVPEQELELRIHDAITGKMLLKWTDPSISLNSQVKYNYSGSRVLTIDPEAVLWDADTGNKLATLNKEIMPGSRDDFRVFCFSDNDEFILGCEKRQFSCWRAESGVILHIQLPEDTKWFPHLVTSSNDIHCAVFVSEWLEIWNYIIWECVWSKTFLDDDLHAMRDICFGGSNKDKLGTVLSCSIVSLGIPTKIVGVLLPLIASRMK